MERTLKIGFVVILVVYFIGAVVMRIPAQWATKAAVDSVQGLKLGGVSGTVWKGKASSAVVVVQGQNIDLGGLSWEVNASSLLALNICADVSSNLFEANVCRSLSGNNYIHDLIVEELPAKLLNNMLGFARVEGNFSLVLKNAEVNDKGIVQKMDALFMWERARGDAGGGWFDLGSFSADIKENGEGGLLANIKDTAGDFAMDLHGDYSIAKGPSIKGTVTPRPEAHVQLVDSLGLFAEAKDDGSFYITWPM